MDIVNIENPKKHPIDHQNIQFESLSTYLDIARKMIISCAPNLRSGLREEMLASEDAISRIAESIMRADWQFNGVGNISGYRSYRAVCAMKSYMSTKKQNHKRHGVILSLDHDMDNNGRRFQDIVPAPIKHSEPYKNIQDQEVYKLLDTNNITLLQKQRIYNYYIDGLTLSNIATKSGVTKQAVSLSIKNGLANIKKAKQSASQRV